MTYSVAIHDAQSGDLVDLVDEESCDWGIGDETQRQMSVVLNADPDKSAADWGDLFDSWTRMIVVRWDGQPLTSTFINTYPDYDEASTRLQIGHIAPMALLRRRHLYGVGSYDASAEMDFRGYSTRGVLRQLLYYGLQHPFSPAWPISSDVGGAELGSSPWALYEHFRQQKVGDLIDDVLDDGPDLALTPTYVNGRHVLQARIGTPYLSGEVLELPITLTSTPESLGEAPTMFNVHRQGDASEQATGAFTSGNGSEQDMRVGQAALPFGSYGVSRDFDIPYKDVTDVGRLNSLARAWLEAHKEPRQQWSFDVITDHVSPVLLREGATVVTHNAASLWKPQSEVALRVLGVSSSTSSSVMTVAAEVI